jgi:uncharacterized phage infection (PIP) family protein YhgE
MTKTISPKKKPEAQEEVKQTGVDLANAPLVKGHAGERDSVDRIRDILFGAQVRQYDQRFHGVEEMIKKEVVNLRDETRKTNETLEHYAKKGLESLIAQLKAEQTERSDSINDVSRKLDNLNKTLDKKMSRLEETTNAGRLDLQEQILQQSKNLMQEIQQWHAELTATMRKAVEELRREKADRMALGNLFNEIGLRLKEEFKLPDVK